MNRKSFEVRKTLCILTRTKKDKLMMEKGHSRIRKLLEVDTFIKSQVKLKVAIETLFTRAERLLIRNNRHFVIMSQSDDKSSEQSDNGELKNQHWDRNDLGPHFYKMLN